MTKLVWVTDPTLDLDVGTHLGPEPLGELLKAESELLWSVLRPPDRDGYRMPPFAGWNIAVARIHVIARDATQIYWTPVKLVEETDKKRELVFLSGRTAADVLDYVSAHYRTMFNERDPAALNDAYRFIGLGEAFAAASGSWDEGKFHDACVTSARELGLSTRLPRESSYAAALYHSEQCLFYLLRTHLPGIVDAALGTIPTEPRGPARVARSATSDHTRRRVDVSRTDVIRNGLRTVAVVVDVATSRTMCRHCQKAAAALLKSQLRFPIHIRAIAEVWFEDSLKEAVSNLANRGGHRFLHTHHDAYLTREKDGEAGLSPREDVAFPIEIPSIPGASTKPSPIGSAYQSIIIPPNDNARSDFVALWKLAHGSDADKHLAERMIRVLRQQAVDRRETYADRAIWVAMRDLEVFPDDSDTDADPDYVDGAASHNASTRPDSDDDATDVAFLEYLETLDEPPPCGLGLVSCAAPPDDSMDVDEQPASTASATTATHVPPDSQDPPSSRSRKRPRS